MSILLEVLGAATLLLWGLSVLKKSMLAGFGTKLRVWLASATKNRALSFASGLGVTVAVQSSTATALMLAGFVGQGFVTAAMAQAGMLGANLGTSLVSQLLSLDLHWLSPATLVLGFALQRLYPERRLGHMGGVFFGFGLVLVGLEMVGRASVQMQHGQSMDLVLQLMADVPLLALLTGAVLATLSASSMAVVLFVMAISAAGQLSADLTLMMVAGANLGGAIPPIFATRNEGIHARRVMIGNLLVRAAGVAAVLVLQSWISLPDIDSGRLAVDLHVLFNLALCLLFLPLVGQVSKLMAVLLPERVADEPRSHLGTASEDEPVEALAAATREALRIGDMVELMLEKAMAGLLPGGVVPSEAIGLLENNVDLAQGRLKLFMSRLMRHPLSDAQRERSLEIMSYALNLEHVGDIIDRSLNRLLVKSAERQAPLSSEGISEIDAIYHAVLSNLHAAQTVFLSRDLGMARQLMETKVQIRSMVRRSQDRHFRRLQDGRADSIQTSGLHLDMLRDLKRINAHIVAVTEPVLLELGQLRDSRLTEW